MRRYDDPVEVRRGPLPGPDQLEGPEQFLWRGRLWKVRAVLAHWVETGPWWASPGVRAVIGTDADTVAGADAGPDADLDPRPGSDGGPTGSVTDLLVERELWRVEAGRGLPSDGGGVFDLSFDWTDGSWQLVGCVD